MRRIAIATGLLIAGLAGSMTLALVRSGNSATVATSAVSENPVLINTCLISKDIQTMAVFYQRVLEIAPQFTGETYAEFKTGNGTLSIFDSRAQESYIPGSAESSANRSAILEFSVEDVDREYTRLQSIVKTWVKPPTTQPWGTRSIYFRDPDGNLVNFFAAAKAKR